MITVMQTIFDNKLGDCGRACIASILELPITSVPNFSESEEKWWKAYDEFAEKHGFIILEFQADEWNVPKFYHIKIGKSPRGEYNHAVVGFGDEVVHDPFPDGGGLDGNAKLIDVLVPIDPARFRMTAAIKESGQ